MFGFKSIFTVFVAVTSFTSALPNPSAGGALVAKREADASPAPHALPQPVPVELEVRQLPVSIPDAINIASSALGPILSSIDNALNTGATTSVLNGLLGQMLPILNQLTSDITNLGSSGGNILGGLATQDVAGLYSTLFNTVTSKLSLINTTLGILKVQSISSTLGQVTTSLSTGVNTITSVVTGISAFLIADIQGALNTLISLVLSLGLGLNILSILLGLLAL